MARHEGGIVQHFLHVAHQRVAPVRDVDDHMKLLHVLHDGNAELGEPPRPFARIGERVRPRVVGKVGIAQPVRKVPGERHHAHAARIKFVELFQVPFDGGALFHRENGVHGVLFEVGKPPHAVEPVFFAPAVELIERRKGAAVERAVGLKQKRRKTL